MLKFLGPISQPPSLLQVLSSATGRMRVITDRTQTNQIAVESLR